MARATKTPEASRAESEDEPEAPQFHYIKSNFFRVIHVDGAYGGVSPRGYIQAAFYSERGAIPRLTERGKIVETKGGVVREIEAQVVFDINTALEFHKWLGRHIKTLRETMAIPDDVWEKMTAEKKADSDE